MHCCHVLILALARLSCFQLSRVVWSLSGLWWNAWCMQIDRPLLF